MFREYIIEQKVYKHRRHRRHYHPPVRYSSLNNGTVLRQVKGQFIEEFEKRGFLSKYESSHEIKVPQRFTFKGGYDESLCFIRKLISSYVFLKEGHIKIDFSDCEEMSIACFTMFHVVNDELKSLRERYNQRLGRYRNTSREVRISHPSKKDDKTNKFLIANDYIDLKDTANVNGEEMFLPLPIIRGKHRAYYENMKSKAARTIVRFLNTALERANNEMGDDGKALETFTTEILTNAEEHSLFKSEWFVSGISFAEEQHNKDIVEVNLSIINIGQTMFEGFEETKELNKDNYNKVDAMYRVVHKKMTSSHNYSREALFMLYMLNPKVSRLRYEDTARGNGTMTFIEKFLLLGRYGEKDLAFNPQMNIISGKSILTCDGIMKPYISPYTGLKVMSLNRCQSPAELPDPGYVDSYSEFFPGTILECKIYLSKENVEASN